MADAAPLVGSPAVATGVSGASVALVVVDDQCQVAEASLAACRLLGVSRDEIVSRSLAELFSPAAAERFEGVWQAFHETGGHAGPFELAWPNGASALDINVTSAVLPDRHLVVLSSSQGQAVDGSGPDRDRRLPSRGPTSRERQILSMLAAGDTDVQIAEKLDLSPATVQTHVRNAKAKLSARTRAQAVAMALQQGLISGT